MNATKDEDSTVPPAGLVIAAGVGPDGGGPGQVMMMPLSAQHKGAETKSINTKLVKAMRQCAAARVGNLLRAMTASELMDWIVAKSMEGASKLRMKSEE